MREKHLAPSPVQRITLVRVECPMQSAAELAPKRTKLSGRRGVDAKDEKGKLIVRKGWK